ncbi:hypothetical protein TNCV_2119471 [Trichonephila clavipes]|nr:hypothetical protein TNCV_2119471 [Trichonephila clavipes]
MLWGGQVAGRNYPPTNKNTLIRALTEEWDKLPQQLLDNVVQSMSRCRNCGGGDRGRVAIYRPFGELRRAKIVLSPVWCSRPTTGVPLAHATMNFVGLDLAASDRRHLDAFTRGRIIGKLEEGHSVTSVFAEFGIAHSIVSRYWRQFQTTGTAASYPEVQ